MKKKDSKIYIHEGSFKEFFYYGIENKEELELGLLHFTLRQVDSENIREEQKEKINLYVQELKKVFLQYMRFIVSPDNPKNYQIDEIPVEEIQWC